MDISDIEGILESWKKVVNEDRSKACIEEIPEALKLILAQHNAQHQHQNPIQLVQGNELKEVIDKTIANHEMFTEQRHQFIAQYDNHFLAIDLKLNEMGKAQAVILDAAGDPRANKAAETLLKVSDVETIYLSLPENKNMGIQKDHTSCPVFSYCHAVDLQELDIHQHMEQQEVEKTPRGDKVAYVNLGHFPPELYKYCQSSRQWDSYKEKYAKTFNVDEDYFNSFDEYREHMRNPNGSANIIPAVFEEKIYSPAKEYIAQISAESDLLLSLSGNEDFNFNLGESDELQGLSLDGEELDFSKFSC